MVPDCVIPNSVTLMIIIHRGRILMVTMVTTTTTRAMTTAGDCQAVITSTTLKGKLARKGLASV